MRGLVGSTASALTSAPSGPIGVQTLRPAAAGRAHTRIAATTPISVATRRHPVVRASRVSIPPSRTLNPRSRVEQCTCPAVVTRSVRCDVPPGAPRLAFQPSSRAPATPRLRSRGACRRMAVRRTAGMSGGVAIESPRRPPPGDAPHRHAGTRPAATPVRRALVATRLVDEWQLNRGAASPLRAPRPAGWQAVGHFAAAPAGEMVNLPNAKPRSTPWPLPVSSSDTVPFVITCAADEVPAPACASAMP